MLLAITFAITFAGTASAAPPAAGGVGLLEALERSPLTAVGELAEVRRLDRHGYVASLRVSHVVAAVGDAAQIDPGSLLSIAWEELAPARTPRFAKRSRVLVSLVTLPGSSLWRGRLPDEEERRRVWAVAGRGNAFLRDPSEESTVLLQRLAALAPEARAGAAGFDLLAALSATGAPALSAATIERLAATTTPAEPMSAATARALVTALLRPDLGEGSVRSLLRWIERERPEALRAPLSREAAATPPAIAAVAGLAALEGGLSSTAAERLALNADPAWRRLAAEWDAGPGAEARIGRLARRDSDASVRRSAVARLARMQGPDADAALLHALGDEDVVVRGEAIRAVARRGPALAPALREIALAGRGDAARSAVAALDAVEPREAVSLAILREIADEHDDPGMRLLASVALGRPIGDD